MSGSKSSGGLAVLLALFSHHTNNISFWFGCAPPAGVLYGGDLGVMAEAINHRFIAAWDGAAMPLTSHFFRDGPAAWLPAGVLSVCMAGALLAVMRPRPGGLVALVYPPWWSAQRTIEAAAAAGDLVRFGAWPGIVVVRPAPGAGDGGAWFRLDPLRSGLCGDSR